MSAIDEFLGNNEAFAQGFYKGDLPLPPAKKVAIVACMDARLNPYPILGLEIGDAHVIRNAGGVITDDEIRSLAISQHLLVLAEAGLVEATKVGRQRIYRVLPSGLQRLQAEIDRFWTNELDVLVTDAQRMRSTE